jgi:hypothetical protein
MGSRRIRKRGSVKIVGQFAIRRLRSRKVTDVEVGVV